MNVTDLRQQLRRSALDQRLGLNFERRKGADRRQQKAVSSALDNCRRIWLTPGERTLIEDLYLLAPDE